MPESEWWAGPLWTARDDVRLDEWLYWHSPEYTAFCEGLDVDEFFDAMRFWLGLET